MKIQQLIKNRLTHAAAKHRIVDVRIGLGYTAVMLENMQTGLAGTPISHLQSCCTFFDAMLPLTGRNANDLLDFLTSDDPLETAVGLATANALTNYPSPNQTIGDVLNLLTISPEDHVAMVGNFAPMIGPVKNAGASLTIFEQIDSPEGELRPASEIPNLLPKCTVCLLTATSVINHTFDKIMDTASKCRSVVLIGASTPLIPEIFTHTPVSLLSGVIVTKPKEILHIVSCGGGMQRFKNVIKKVNLPV